MRTLVWLVEMLIAPLAAAADHVSRALALAAQRPLRPEDFVVAAFAISAGCIGFGSGVWAIWNHVRLGGLRLGARRGQVRDRAALEMFKALLESSRQNVVVLGKLNSDLLYFGRGSELLQASMEGPDAPRLATALNGLLSGEKSFEMAARRRDEDSIAIRGLKLGRHVVLFLEDGIETRVRYREILDALPIPLWIRRSDLTLSWGNAAFLKSAGFPALKSALAADAGFIPSERNLVANVLENKVPIAARCLANRNGERRAFALHFAPTEEAGVLGTAIDITEFTQSQAGLRCALEAGADMLNRLPIGVAVFGPDQQLLSHNSRYAQLWGFSESWLESRPGLGEILDRLRETRKLPEHRDFAGWKKQQLDAAANRTFNAEEFWHLPGGRSLRVAAAPYLGGGTFFLFEDMTEQFHLQASLSLLTQVQRATLDSVEEGVAIFGADGRLVLHNTAFANFWKLAETELAGHPHFSGIADLCAARFGRDGIWNAVSAGVNAMDPRLCAEWGKSRRADGRVVSLSMSRLPNGGTAATFTDLTEIEHFETHTTHAAA
jgi:PAS domain-containing protein